MPVSRPDGESSSAGRSVLPAEVANFLIQFSIYLHQQQAYPAGHPVLTSSASAAVMRLSSLLLDRDGFAIGVAGDRLVIDGTSTDPSHPVLRDLAAQLHGQQIGVLRFWRGVSPHELEDLASAMALARTADRPLGLEDNTSRWAHIRLERHAYHQLVLEGDGQAGGLGATGTTATASTSVNLWMALASTALANEGDTSEANAGEIARAIERRVGDADYDRVIVDYLLQLGRETGSTATLDHRVKGQLQELLRSLTPDALRQLLQLGATLDQRRELVALAARDLPTSTVMLILNAAAAESGQTISHTLLRILGKLSLQADQGPLAVRPVAEAAVRDSVRRLLDQWTLTDPNPSAHTRALDRLARSSVATDGGAAAGQSSALRIIQMSLEIGVPGPMLQGAVKQMVIAGELTTLLDLLKDAPPSKATAGAWDYLATPEVLDQLLEHEELDPGTVENLINRLGTRAAAPMLEALSTSSSRTVRRRLLTWLRHMGPGIGPLLVQRLPDAPWYVQRNLLTLLGTMAALPDGFQLAPYAVHSDARVRREALKIMMRFPESYEEGILRSIRDDDSQIVTLGLTLAAERFPPTAGNVLLAAIHRREWPAELKVQAIRLLAFSSSPQVCRWLVEQSLVRRKLFRKNRLAPRSPELLAVLGVIAARWAHDPRAAEVLKLGRESRDGAIRAAASGKGDG